MILAAFILLLIDPRNYFTTILTHSMGLKEQSVQYKTISVACQLRKEPEVPSIVIRPKMDRKSKRRGFWTRTDPGLDSIDFLNYYLSDSINCRQVKGS